MANVVPVDAVARLVSGREWCGDNSNENDRLRTRLDSVFTDILMIINLPIVVSL